jgi:hypothetical protein
MKILSDICIKNEYKAHKYLKLLRYIFVFLILVICFSFIILIYNKSINTSINNISNNMGLNNNLLDIDKASAAYDLTDTGRTITISKLTVPNTDPVLLFAGLITDLKTIKSTSINSVSVKTNLTVKLDGDLKKAAMAGRISVQFVINTNVYYENHAGTSITHKYLLKVNNVDLANIDSGTQNNEYKTLQTGLIDLTSLANNGFTIIFEGINSFISTTHKEFLFFDVADEAKGRLNLKDITMSYGVVYERESSSYGSLNTVRLPSVAFNTTYQGSLENSTGLDNNNKILDLATEATIRTKLLKGYYFTGWTDDNNKNAIKENKLQLTVKSPYDITYVANNDTLRFTAQYTQIAMSGNTTYPYKRSANSPITQGPYINDISGYSILNYYGTSALNLTQSSRSPFSNVGEYYFYATIGKNGEIVGETEIIPFNITQATFNLGISTQNLILKYGEALKDKTSYFSVYNPVYDGIAVSGDYVWEYPNAVLPINNTNSYKFTFVPTDQANFKSIEITLTKDQIKVDPGELTILDNTFQFDAFSIGDNAWTNINQITYENSLYDILLRVRIYYLIANNNASIKSVINGIWKLYKTSEPTNTHDYTKDIPTVSDSTANYYLKFIPDENPTWYAEFKKIVNIKVVKATPGITLSQTNILVGDLTYGMSLIDTASSKYLSTNYDDSNGSNILAGTYYKATNISLAEGTTIAAGRFVWFEKNGTSALGSIVDAGLQEFTIRYIPDDLDNYNIALFENRSFIVNKASPQMATQATYVKSNPITYGEALASATFNLSTGDNNNTVKNQHSNVLVDGVWMWYLSDMQNSGIQNINYPTVIDGSGPGYNGGKGWAVYFVPTDLTNYISSTSENGCLIQTSYLKVNPATQKLYYSDITTDDTNIKKIDGLNEYTAKSTQNNAPTEILIKIYTTALEYVTANEVNPIEIGFAVSPATNNIVSVVRTGMSVVDYSTISSFLNDLAGSYNGNPSRLTEIIIKLTVSKITTTDYATGQVTLNAYETNSTNYQDVQQSEVTKITFKRESQINISDVIRSYYSIGIYNLDAAFLSGYKEYNLIADKPEYVDISENINGIYTIDFLKAGVVNLTISCDDYIIRQIIYDQTIDVNYFGVSESVTLYIEKTPVIVTHDDISITYGDELEIDYNYFKFSENSDITGVNTISGLENNALKLLFPDIVSEYNKDFEYQVDGDYNINLYSKIADFDNYILEYKPGRLIVKKKEIKVGLNYSTLYKIYGDSIIHLRDSEQNLVTLALVYKDNKKNEGNAVWEYNDYDSQNDRINPAKGIILPVIIYNFNTESVVSSAPYVISINLTDTGNNNYTFSPGENSTTSVIITKRSVLISADDYTKGLISGQSDPPDLVVNAFGYDNTNLSSQGSFSFRYATSISANEEYNWLDWISFKENAAGSVAVEITFAPDILKDAYKNYKTTVTIKNNITQMALAKPIISFYDIMEGVESKVVLEFTGFSFNYNKIASYIKTSAPPGIVQQPVGTFDIKFQFQSTSDENSSVVDITNVLQVGMYKVIIIFNPVDNTVYDTHSVTITDMFEVIPTKPGVNPDPTIVVYNGLPAQVKMPTISTFQGYGLQGNSWTINLEYSLTGENNFDVVIPRNAGIYDVQVSFSGDNHNYAAFSGVIFSKYLEIQTYSFINDMEMPEPVSIKYTGNAIENSLTVYYAGLSEGDETKGVFSYAYRINGNTGNANITQITDANSYDMLITYTSGIDDNYASGARWLTNAIKITPIDLDIRLTSLNRNYTYSGNVITYNVNQNIYALKPGSESEKIASKSIMLSYAKKIGGDLEWTTSTPVNAGDYSLRVIFTPNNSNYNVTVADFDNAITISKFNTFVQFSNTEFDYDEIITNDTIKGLVTITKAQHDITYPTPKEYVIEVEGLEKEDNVFKIINPGIYSVTVTLNFDENSNYSTVSGSGSITIKNILPDIVFVDTTSKLNEVYYYSGIAIAAHEAWPLITDKDPYAYGKMEYSYRMYGEGDTAWTSTVPINIGVYDVKATYIPRTSDGDNYSENFKVFIRNIEIRPMLISVKVYQLNDHIYNGIKASVDNLTYVFEDSDGRVFVLPDSAKISGSFIIGSGMAVNAGTYPIQRGDFNIKSENGIDNYNEEIITNSNYIIEKRPFSCNFTYNDNIYDGKTKSVSLVVTNGCIIDDDDVHPNIQYFGETINVSSNGFNVRITSLYGTDANNYIINDSDNLMNFKIEPAKITDGVEFNDVIIGYNGLTHSLEVTNAPDDCIVQYSMQNLFRMPGIYTLTATISKTNYEDLVLTASMIIEKVALNITNDDLEIDNIDDLRYGQAIPRITVVSADGSAVFKETTLLVGTNMYEWEFTPNDPNYLSSTGKIQLDVKKAIPTIIINEINKNFSTDSIQIISANNIIINSKNAKFLFTSNTGKIYEDVTPSEPGVYKLDIIYAGDENNDSITVTYQYTVSDNSSDNSLLIVMVVVLTLMVLLIFVAVIRRRKARS